MTEDDVACPVFYHSSRREVVPLPPPLSAPPFCSPHSPHRCRHHTCPTPSSPVTTRSRASTRSEEPPLSIQTELLSGVLMVPAPQVLHDTWLRAPLQFADGFPLQRHLSSISALQVHTLRWQAVSTHPEQQVSLPSSPNPGT